MLYPVAMPLHMLFPLPTMPLTIFSILFGTIKYYASFRASQALFGFLNLHSHSAVSDIVPITVCSASHTKCQKILEVNRKSLVSITLA